MHNNKRSYCRSESDLTHLFERLIKPAVIQPYTLYRKMSGDWSNGLCSCFEDCSTCIVSYFCPCYTAGKNAEAVGKSCVLHAIFFYIPIANFVCRSLVREAIRESKGIEGSCYKDCLCVTFCGLCSLVQEARELKGPGGQAMARE